MEEADTQAPQAPPEDSEPLPEQVAGYRILELLGRGGMGSVYLAEDTRGGDRRVALKVVRDRDGDPALRRRFEREAAIGHELGKSPGFVRALDWGPAPEGLYLALELVEDARSLDLITGTLLDRLRRVAIACGIVAEAHRRGVVHRDLKPQNFLVTRDDQVFLTDFGLAKVTEDQDLLEVEAEGAGDRNSVTRTGACLGTPAYMAPEQFDDAKYADQRADSYSLGVMLFLALTGNYPFAKEFAAIYFQQECVRQGRRAAPRPSDVVQGIPPELDDLCARAISIGREDRPSARELRRGIEGALANWNLDPGTTTLTPPPIDQLPALPQLEGPELEAAAQGAPAAGAPAIVVTPRPSAADPERAPTAADATRSRDGGPPRVTAREKRVRGTARVDGSFTFHGSQEVARDLRRARWTRRLLIPLIVIAPVLLLAALAVDLGGVQGRLPPAAQAFLVGLSARVYERLTDEQLQRLDLRAPSLAVRPVVQSGVDWTSAQRVRLVVEVEEAALAQLTADDQPVPLPARGGALVVTAEVPLPLGEHTVRLRAVDRAGHAAEAEQKVLRVDPERLISARCVATTGGLEVTGRLTPPVAREVRVGGQAAQVAEDGTFRCRVGPTEDLIGVEVASPRGDTVTSWVAPPGR
ncbi:MAG: protein kinase [Planctomycetota bacterium]